MSARLHKFAALIWANTDNLTKWIQVTALVFAAIWTYFQFRTIEAPGLEIPPAVSMNPLSFNWRPEPTPGSCWIESNLEVKNVGVRSFDVEKVRLKTWHQDLQLQPVKLNFINFPQIEAAPPMAMDTPPSLIIRRFAPKDSIHDGFTWIFSGRPAPGLYIFGADIEGKKGEVLGFAAAWTDRLCQ